MPVEIFKCFSANFPNFLDSHFFPGWGGGTLAGGQGRNALMIDLESVVSCRWGCRPRNINNNGSDSTMSCYSNKVSRN